MSAAEEITEEVNDGPPAKNLRKVSGRTLSSETNMAIEGDKSERTELNIELKHNSQQNKGRKKDKDKGPKRDNTTPSVKSFFESSETEINTEDRTEGENYQTHDNYDTTSQPGEDWSTDDQEDALIELRRTTRVPPYEHDNGASEERHEEVDDFPANPQTLEPDFDNMSHKEIKDLVKEMYLVIKNIEATLQKREKDVPSIANFKALDDKVKLINKTVIKHDRSLASSKDKVNKIECQMLKKNLVITGITEEKNENCQEKIKSFFKDKMKINTEVPIAIAHRIGNKDKGTRPMIVKLTDASSKASIYKHSKNLKESATT